MINRVVIIGAGQAAAQLALSLRQGKFAGDIHVIGDEPYAPYQRPPLSKKFLHERPSPDSLFFRPASYWREQGVTLELATHVAAIERQQRQLALRDRRRVPYDVLVLATGTRA